MEMLPKGRVMLITNGIKIVGCSLMLMMFHPLVAYAIVGLGAAATVDDVDATAGKVAMVFALLGANGDFGVKDSADRLLPELLVPTGSPGQ